VPGAEDAFILSRFDDDKTKIPLELFGTDRRLYVQQVIRVLAIEGEKHCQTDSYRYSLQEADGTILVRWEYDRDRPRADYPYPLAHVHVHGALSDGTELKQLHISTARVPIELVLWHLISEGAWGVKPRTDDWQPILQESIDGWKARRTRS
jgi:hypothetical protein